LKLEKPSAVTQGKVELTKFNFPGGRQWQSAKESS